MHTSLDDLHSFDFASLFEQKMACVVISFYLRSGSYLTHSLLDGHSKILCLPPWASLIYREENLVESLAAYVNGNGQKTFANTMNLLMQPAKLWEKHNQGSTVYCYVGDNADIAIDQPMDDFLFYLRWFISFLQEHNLASRRNFLLATALAYNLAQGISLDELAQKTHLLYQMHAPLLNFLPTIQEDFGQVYFLQSIRNPLRALASHIEEYTLYAPDNIPHLFEWLFTHATLPSCLKAQDCMAVKNEYLHAHGKLYIERILQGIGLAFEDICEKSTLNGQAFWWTKKGKIFTGLNPKLQEDFCQTHNHIFDCHDKVLLSYFLTTRFQAWKYEHCAPQHFMALLRQSKEHMLEIQRENPTQSKIIQEYFADTQTDILTLHLVLSLHFFGQNPIFKEQTETIVRAFLRGLQHSKSITAFMPLVAEEGLSPASLSCTR